MGNWTLNLCETGIQRLSWQHMVLIAKYFVAPRYIVPPKSIIIYTLDNLPKIIVVYTKYASYQSLPAVDMLMFKLVMILWIISSSWFEPLPNALVIRHYVIFLRDTLKLDGWLPYVLVCGSRIILLRSIADVAPKRLLFIRLMILLFVYHVAVDGISQNTIDRWHLRLSAFLNVNFSA